MTYEQITDLIAKGFTPDQITLLTTTAAPTAAVMEDAGGTADPLVVSPEASPTPSADPEPEPDTYTQPAPAAAPTPEPAPAADGNLKEVMNAIADLKKSMQAQNIRTMSMDGPSQDNELEKAMAEFIRPSFQKGD